MVDSKLENVIIIGGGPAGLSAAIYLARANLNPLVFAGSVPGGQLTLTSEVENYPGFESILGSELIEKMRSQAKKFGTRIVDENVMKVDFAKQIKSVEIRQNQIESDKIRQSRMKSDKSGSIRLNPISSNSIQLHPILSKSIIITTGAKALWLNLPSEQRLRGKGVSACATCDGFFFRDKTVAVVGGGDTALEEALTLTKFAKKVYIIHRRDFFRASKIMQDRVFKNKKIEIIYNTAVEEIMGEKKVEGVRLRINQKRSAESEKIRNQKNSDKSDISDLSGLSGIRPSLISSDYSGLSELKLDGVFVAIGHKPDTNLFKGQVEVDEKGYIITSVRKALEEVKSQKSKVKNTSQNLKVFNFDYQSMTSVEGIFAAGDCADPVYQQAATAVGMGVTAALEVEKYLDEAR